MCTKIIDYINYLFFILDIIIVIEDLMHVLILNEHLSSQTITWLCKLLYCIDTFLAVSCTSWNNSYLGLYLQKNNKTKKQTKQKKNGKKKRERRKKRKVLSRTGTRHLRLDATKPYHYAAKEFQITFQQAGICMSPQWSCGAVEEQMLIFSSCLTPGPESKPLKFQSPSLS